MARAKSQVTTVGDFTLVFSHALIALGLAVSWKGFKVESDIIDSSQIMPNSKMVPLIGQIVAIITNNVRAGTIKLNATSGDGDETSGDVVAACHFLQNVGDNVGGTLIASFGQNGKTRRVTFYDVTVINCPPLRIAGNDVASYPIELGYSDFEAA